MSIVRKHVPTTPVGKAVEELQNTLYRTRPEAPDDVWQALELLKRYAGFTEWQAEHGKPNAQRVTELPETD